MKNDFVTNAIETENQQTPLRQNQINRRKFVDATSAAFGMFLEKKSFVAGDKILAVVNGTGHRVVTFSTGNR